MTIALALLALVLPSLILVAWTLERRERAAEHRELVAAHERERDSWVADRRELLNRIKPETGQAVPARQRSPAQSVQLDDDESYWSAATGMSKEELAVAVDEAERAMAANGGMVVPGEAGDTA